MEVVIPWRGFRCFTRPHGSVRSEGSGGEVTKL